MANLSVKCAKFMKKYAKLNENYPCSALSKLGFKPGSAAWEAVTLTIMLYHLGLAATFYIMNI